MTKDRNPIGRSWQQRIFLALILGICSGALLQVQPGYGESHSSQLFAVAGELDDFIITDPQTPEILYAGTPDLGVYKSIDGGKSWNPKNDGLSVLQVNVLAMDPANPNILYAGTGDGVFRSIDGGETWNGRNTGLTDTHILSLVVDPLHPSMLYAGTRIGVFASSDGGEKWVAWPRDISGNDGSALMMESAKPDSIDSRNAEGVLAAEQNGVIFAVNCGGPRYVDETGIVYQADIGFSGGNTYATAAAIQGTAEGLLYQTERYGNFAYSIPVPNGSLLVTLKFAEIYPYISSGTRIFDVKIEGREVVGNLDLLGKAGKNKAYDVKVPVSVADGMLNIEFLADVGSAKVNAILVTAGGNLPPAAQPQSVSTAQNTPVPIILKASDPNDDFLTYTVVTTPTSGTLSGLPPNLTYTPHPDYTGSDSLIFTANDGQVDGNLAAVSITVKPPLHVALAINAGGPGYVDKNGVVYEADTYFSGGSTYRTGALISGTEDGFLYQTERFGDFSYNLPLPNGNYSVTLKFAELYYNSSGRRSFEVKIGGDIVINRLDVFAQAGKNKAYDVTISDVSVTDGVLNIEFRAGLDAAKVNAILVAPNQPMPGNIARVALQQGLNGYTGNTNATLDSWKPDVNTSSPAMVISLRTYASSGVSRFDLSALPANAYVTKAILSLYVLDKSNASTATLNIYRLCRPWQASQVTWHQAAAGNEWEGPGANDMYLDRAAAPSASVSLDSVGTFYTLDLTALVRDWVHNPLANYGMLLELAGSSSVQYHIVADSFGTAERRMKLTLTYSISPENDFPPTITITSPPHNTFVQGTTPIAAKVQDDRGIAAVEYFLDGNVIATVTEPPYQISWDTSTAPVGRHQLKVRVRDTAGQIAEETILVNAYQMDDNILTVAHITDVHVGTPMPEGWPSPALTLQRFQQAMQELNGIVKPAVIIDTGDLTNMGDDYSFQLYASIAGSSAIPVRASPGNHDLASEEGFKAYVGPLRTWFDLGAHRFIGFTTTKLDASWLLDLLAATERKGIVFSHYVWRIPQDSSESMRSYGLPPAEVAALQNAMTTYRAPAYLSGHFHQPFLLEDNVSHAVNIGGPSLGQKMAYNIITSDNGLISSNVHYLGDWPEIVITRPQRYYLDGGTRTISGTVPIRAKLFGDAPITSVRLAVDGKSCGLMSGLGSNVWQTMWDTGTAAKGLHTLTVSATDNRGRSRETFIYVKVE